MRLVVVWLAVIAAVAVISIAWVAFTPVFYSFQEELNTTIAPELEGEAATAYNRLWSFSGIILKLTVPVFILAYIVWGLLNMQQRERVTGVYG